MLLTDKQDEQGCKHRKNRNQQSALTEIDEFLPWPQRICNLTDDLERKIRAHAGNDTLSDDGGNDAPTTCNVYNKKAVPQNKNGRQTQTLAYMTRLPG